MATLSENATRIVNALGDIKQAIIDKGVTPSGKCETYADAIDDIFQGVDVSGDTATEMDVFSGKTFHLADGTQATGQAVINDNFEKSLRVLPGISQYNIQNMALNEYMQKAKINVIYELSASMITPSTEEQTIGLPPASYMSKPIGWGSIHVDAVTCDLPESNEILQGKSVTISSGDSVLASRTGSMTNNGSVSASLDASTNSYTVPEGYHSGSGKVSISTQTKTATPKTTDQTISADSGKVISSVTVKGVTCNLPSADKIRKDEVASVTSNGTTLASVTGTYEAEAADPESVYYAISSNGTASITVDANKVYLLDIHASQGSTASYSKFDATQITGAEATQLCHLQEVNAYSSGTFWKIIPTGTTLSIRASYGCVIRLFEL